jgi:YgiT-type zinc finger domain-containing protein
MTKTTQSNICSRCGGTLVTKKITYPQEIAGKVYFVEDVPALVCSECGEIYLAPDTVDAIQTVLEKRKASETIKVPVYHFPFNSSI